MLIRIDSTFRANYRVKPLIFRPKHLPWAPRAHPVYPMPGTERSVHAAGYLAVVMADGERFLLQLGAQDGGDPNHACTCPNPDHLLVVDDGDAFLVEVGVPPRIQRVPSMFLVYAVEPVPEAGVVVITGAVGASCVDSGGIRWACLLQGVDAQRHAVVGDTAVVSLYGGCEQAVIRLNTGAVSRERAVPIETRRQLLLEGGTHGADPTAHGSARWWRGWIDRRRR